MTEKMYGSGEMVTVEGMVFEKACATARFFYLEHGYCHFRGKSLAYAKMLDECFDYYNENANRSSHESAFRNSDGVPRHIIDIFRDSESPALRLYRSEYFYSLIECLYPSGECLTFTHSKLSFKEPGAVVDWFPHQDNGYKKLADRRVGFAVFVCLEDMNSGNGCLEVFPGSHKFGTQPHERIVEDEETGDNQLRISSIPNGLAPFSVEAAKGDVIVFSADTIHQSGSSSSGSRRLAIIAEVEAYRRFRLDDYGKPPLTVRGLYGRIDATVMSLCSLLSPYAIWRFIKKNRHLALLIRKIRY